MTLLRQRITEELLGRVRRTAVGKSEAGGWPPSHNTSLGQHIADNRLDDRINYKTPAKSNRSGREDESASRVLVISHVCPAADAIELSSGDDHETGREADSGHGTVGHRTGVRFPNARDSQSPRAVGRVHLPGTGLPVSK